MGFFPTPLLKPWDSPGVWIFIWYPEPWSKKWMSILNLGMVKFGCPCGVKIIKKKIGWFNAEPKNILFVYLIHINIYNIYIIIYTYIYMMYLSIYECQWFLAPTFMENVKPHVLTVKSWFLLRKVFFPSCLAPRTMMWSVVAGVAVAAGNVGWLSLQDLRPFPTHIAVSYEGHSGMVRAVAVEAGSGVAGRMDKESKPQRNLAVARREHVSWHCCYW